MITLGLEMGGYVLARTTESDEKTGRPSTPGAINGGFYPKMEDPRRMRPMWSLPSTILPRAKKAVAAGGKVHGTPIDIPSIGRYVAIIDTEGNLVGMLQPLPMTSSTQ